MVAVRIASGADRAPLRRSPLLLLLRLTTAVAAAIAAAATRGLPLTARRRRGLVHAVIGQDSLRVVGLERQNWSRTSNPGARLPAAVRARARAGGTTRLRVRTPRRQEICQVHRDFGAPS